MKEMQWKKKEIELEGKDIMQKAKEIERERENRVSEKQM
jgi:hypothetical protein